ncbi:DUF4245 family protein [Glycomyces halotolerans]
MSSDDVKVTGAPQRRPKQRRLRDMALSMAVLLVPLALFYGAWNWASGDRDVSVVNPAEDYAAAESLGLVVVRPELSEEWRPISSALATTEETVTLRTGWYSPEGDGLQLVQTTGEPEAVDEAFAGAGESVEAGGIAWAVFDFGDGEGWVAEAAGSTVILTAEPDGVDELGELAEGVAASL